MNVTNPEDYTAVIRELASLAMEYGMPVTLDARVVIGLIDEIERLQRESKEVHRGVYESQGRSRGV